MILDLDNLIDGRTRITIGAGEMIDGVIVPDCIRFGDSVRFLHFGDYANGYIKRGVFGDEWVRMTYYVGGGMYETRYLYALGVLEDNDDGLKHEGCL